MTAPTLPTVPLPPRGRILVGVDVDTDAVAALQWAHAHAVRSGADLLVVHAVDPQASRHAPYAAGPAVDPAQDLARARSRLQHLVDLTCTGADTTHVISAVHLGPAEQVLVELSGDADLLVVGGDAAARHRSDYLGPVLRTCLHKAVCPVVVVPAPAPPAAPVPVDVVLVDTAPALATG